MPLPEQDIHHFIEVAQAYLKKITGNEIVRRDPSIEFQSLVFSAFTGLIHLKGDVEGFIYFTASQHFLQNLFLSRHNRGRFSEESCRELIKDITVTINHNLEKRFGTTLRLSEPRIFSTVPDDPIEMPPAVFVQPYLWRKEHAYFVLGLSPAEAHQEPTP